MSETLNAFEKRLAPTQDLFFTWLLRVMLSGALAGSAWIDDAPPLELGALLIALFVAAGLLSQFGAFLAAAPFRNRVLRTLFALLALILLGLAFPTTAIFVNTLALSATG